ncbi:tRNA (N6-isopentenyl adenosine(37)-C2)-methylthiotransferase MiaB [bacterium]|nr:tRNA (N6-isopentenyl adenosine(37)-C2)-methylthiotransferase MiaB [candidate division CSSED10-310 bacterium]
MWGANCDSWSEWQKHTSRHGFVTPSSILASRPALVQFPLHLSSDKRLQTLERMIYIACAMLNQQRFYIENFGCQMNVHDSEMLAALLQSHEWVQVSDYHEADVIILNTCSVREKAEQKVFSRFGVLKDQKVERPHVRFILAGCMAKAWGIKLLRRLPYLDLIIGPGMLAKIPEYLQYPSRRYPVVDTNEPESVFSLAPEMIANPQHHSAWVTIMEGCDNFCSYCVVPYVRGRERSRDGHEIAAEIVNLTRRGVREITLLGQNVNSYAGLPGGFPALLRKIHEIDGLMRIRFTTSHPKDMSDELVQTISELPKLCEYLHFPVQSGSTSILRKMRRGYTRDNYLNRIDTIRRLIPDVALSSDFIVGFPGESEQDHQDSVSLIESVGYDNIFIFNYCVRSGTRAADYPDDVPLQVKTKRLEDLLQRQRRIVMARNQEKIGMIVEVLVDGPAKRGVSLWTGRTRQNRVVNFSGTAAEGVLCSVLIESASPNCLYGRIV